MNNSFNGSILGEILQNGPSSMMEEISTYNGQKVEDFINYYNEIFELAEGEKIPVIR